MSIPAPAMIHAMIAPSTPVSVPKRRGNRNTPDPIIEPTTIAVRVGRLTLSFDFSVDASVAVMDHTYQVSEPITDQRGSVLVSCCTPVRRRRRSRAGSPVPATAVMWTVPAPSPDTEVEEVAHREWAPGPARRGPAALPLAGRSPVPVGA